jgi:hypothetical protein
MIRLWRHHEPRHKAARIEEPVSELRVKGRRWRPCEKTRSTAVEDARIQYISAKDSLDKVIIHTWNAEKIASHAREVRIYAALVKPPLEGISYILNRVAKIIVKLACRNRSDSIN